MMSYKEVEGRLFVALNNAPICNDEELIVYMASMTEMPEEYVRQAYREWSQTKFAIKCAE